MRAALAAGLAMALYVGVVTLLRARTKRSLGAVLPIAAALYIGLHGLAFNLLSLGHAVRPVPVAGVECALLAVVVLALRADIDARGLMRLVAFRVRNAGPLFLVAPFLFYLGVTAWRFPPTNWDSMTYHMARVAHWFGNHSVAYFKTQQDAQNTMGPGAEYVLLQLQLLAGDDTWANSVQLVAWLLCALSVSSLARQLGLPARLAPWAGVFVGVLPLATLEATTTQNDLVASLMAVAVVSASLPLMRRRVPSILDVALLGACAGSSFLVKPTSSLAALPFSAFAVGCCLARHWRTPSALARLALALAAPLVLTIGPDAARKLAWTGSLFGGRGEVYPLFGLWKERLFNSVQTYCQNALFPEWTGTVLQRWHVRIFGATTPLFYGNVYRANEDRAGEPIHATLALLLCAWLLVSIIVLAFSRRARSRWRVFAIGATIPAGWFVVHAFLRNSPPVQEFISRLQLPIFVLSPLLWIPFTAPVIRGHRVRGFLLCAVTLFASAAVMKTVVGNEYRSMSANLFERLPDRDFLYYQTRSDAREPQNRALARLVATGCKKVGLQLQIQSYDYPLTWRLMRSGIAVHPYVAPSSWPCAVFTDHGAPFADDEIRWTDTGSGVWRPAR